MSVMAAVIVLLCTGVMMFGVKQSARVNAVITAANLLVLLFVVIAGAFLVEPGNWTAMNDSFVPYGGFSVVKAAGTVFFSYLGFDMVSSLAEEVRNPQRTMPAGIIGSLGIASTVYVGVCLVVTGMVPFTLLANNNAPLSFAFQQRGMPWASYIVAAGSLLGLTSAAFTCLLGQPRIFYRMAADGLLFPMFGQLNSAFVPVAGTLVTGVITAVIAFFVSLDALADAISVGTLCAFTIVDAGIILLRYRTPASSQRVLSWLGVLCVGSLVAGIAFHAGWHWSIFAAGGVVAFGAIAMLSRFPVASMPHTFVCPAVPWLPGAGIVVNLLLMAGLDIQAWLRLAGWTVVGLIIYFGYGIRHSKLKPLTASAAGTATANKSMSHVDSVISLPRAGAPESPDTFQPKRVAAALPTVASTPELLAISSPPSPSPDDDCVDLDEDDSTPLL